MNEIVKIVKTRDEFRELLKTEFIPYMIKNNLNQFIDNKDMFYKWDAFFYENKTEDTVFKPWESDYQTDVSKKVEVKFENKINESFEEPVISKPKMTFSIVPDEFDTQKHLQEIFKILESHKVNRKNLVENKKVFNKLVETYCSLNYINKEENILSIKKDLINKLK